MYIKGVWVGMDSESTRFGEKYVMVNISDPENYKFINGDGVIDSAHSRWIRIPREIELDKINETLSEPYTADSTQQNLKDNEVQKTTTKYYLVEKSALVEYNNPMDAYKDSCEDDVVIEGNELEFTIVTRPKLEKE